MASKSQRWVVDSGILRKRPEEEDVQELLVFGYSCKLFRDDEKAKLIDQGKHLIPWMGDDTLKIDRYDGRGALGDLRMHEPPPFGFDLRTIISQDEYRIERMCDEERYKSLYNNEAEEAMYHEEEIKRLHQALDSENSYSQVAFNYDDEKKLADESQSPKSSSSQDDEAFVPDPELEIPEDMIVPETQKLNAIIVKTALFIRHQGGQMEVLIKTKQADNPQFAFLSIDGELHPYYKHILEAIKSGKYNPEKQPDKEEPAPEEEEEEEEEQSEEEDEPYLHPSLVSSLKVEAAPSIPSINYKPSADCAYSMLVNKITGKPPGAKTAQQQQQQPEIIPPPPMPPMGYYHPMTQGYPPNQGMPQQYYHGPVLYSANGNAPVPQPNQATPMPQYNSSVPAQPGAVTPQVVQTPQKEALAPLVPYGPTPPKPLTRPSFIVPPADVQIIIDKMASYVAKNGRDFEAIVKNKGDPRFSFLELSHQYHGYYAHKLTIYEGGVNPRVLTEEELLQNQELQEEKQKKLEELQKKQQRMEEVQKRVKLIQEKKKGDGSTSSGQSPNKQVTTVSFSIKKPKEGENTVIEKRNALPQEESDDEEASDDNKKEANSKPESPAATVNEKIEKIPSPKIEKEPKKEPKKAPEKSTTHEKKRPTSTKKLSTSDKSAPSEKRASSKPVAPPIKPQVNSDKPLHPEKKAPSRPPLTTNITDIVDLTDDILDDCQLIHTKKKNDDRIKDKGLAVARKKLNATRERQLQLERRRKATMFLSQIHAPTIASVRQEKPAVRPEPQQLAPALLREEAIPVAPPPPGTEELEIEELRMCTNSLMSRLRGSDIKRRRSRQRSKSHSSSDDRSDRHRSHKKHKKKKSSHKSSYRDSVSSSRSHKSKKSKKSSSRHRSRSRSSHRPYTSSRHRRESSSSDSDSNSS